MNREYVIWKSFRNSFGGNTMFSEHRIINSMDDAKSALTTEYNNLYKDDKDFIGVKVEPLPSNDIDFDLMNRMHAIREVCELGHKVRANTKIRNRQPLRNAYVAFTDRDIQEYMVYLDGANNEYANVIGEELNVTNVIFIDDKIEKQIFNFNMKPNFRSLGPKGFGKQAQSLKTYIAAMSNDDRNDLHFKLRNGETVVVLDVPLTYSDVEVEYVPKSNLMFASGKCGTIVLDTKLDDSLIELGFVADFRSAIQSIRRTVNLGITDKIFLKVFCEQKRAETIGKFAARLRKDLLATGIECHQCLSADATQAHKLFFHNSSLKTEDQIKDIISSEIDDEKMYINLYKELQ